MSDDLSRIRESISICVKCRKLLLYTHVHSFSSICLLTLVYTKDVLVRKMDRWLNHRNVQINFAQCPASCIVWAVRKELEWFSDWKTQPLLVTVSLYPELVIRGSQAFLTV